MSEIYPISETMDHRRGTDTGSLNFESNDAPGYRNDRSKKVTRSTSLHYYRLPRKGELTNRNSYGDS